MINLFIFIISLVWWIYRTVNRQFNWLTYVLAFVMGAFFTQTVLWLGGIPTILDNLF